MILKAPLSLSVLPASYLLSWAETGASPTCVGCNSELIVPRWWQSTKLRTNRVHTFCVWFIFRHCYIGISSTRDARKDRSLPGQDVSVSSEHKQ
jgi:hypothetical protein